MASLIEDDGNERTVAGRHAPNRCQKLKAWDQPPFWSGGEVSWSKFAASLPRCLAFRITNDDRERRRIVVGLDGLISSLQ